MELKLLKSRGSRLTLHTNYNFKKLTPINTTSQHYSNVEKMPKPSSSSSKKEVPIELGFLEEEKHKWKLTSPFFPSKFGGLPSWLDLKDIPTATDLKCSGCDKPTKFLLQVYAPQDTDETFHRTIFIFVCPNKACCVERNSNKNLVALRCQLPQVNEFYSSDPPDEKDETLAQLNPTKFGVSMCKICSGKSTQNCSLCKIVHYCGRDHQILDWQSGHKEKCKHKEPLTSEPTDAFCYQEQALVIDTEVIPKPSPKEKDEKARMDEYQKLLGEGQAGTLDDSATTKEALEAASYRSDKAFNKFKKRVAYHPDQVLRYDKNGSPLWVAAEKTIEKADIPPCAYCDGARIFEFQIMPQLLNFVGDDSLIGDLDWGTLAVYTCEKNCSGSGPAYKNEFIWQQDFKSDDKDDD